MRMYLHICLRIHVSRCNYRWMESRKLRLQCKQVLWLSSWRCPQVFASYLWCVFLYFVSCRIFIFCFPGGFVFLLCVLWGPKYWNDLLMLDKSLVVWQYDILYENTFCKRKHSVREHILFHWTSLWSCDNTNACKHAALLIFASRGGRPSIIFSQIKLSNLMLVWSRPQMLLFITRDIGYYYRWVRCPLLDPGGFWPWGHMSCYVCCIATVLLMCC